MPGINFGAPIFRASAGAATDWGSVEGKTEAEFAVGATLKRGLKLEVGLSALVEVDAALAKFISASVSGQASAQARVLLQVQLPMNLFDEAGAAVRLQAVAEAAAGVQASLGLNVGDFVELAKQVIGSDGVPLRLLLLFLEEVELSAGVFAKVAATAQAQAYATVVGTLRNDPARGLKPGFNIVAGAGLGLAAGAGVRLCARAGFRDFPRFYARAVDLAVDSVFDEAATRLGAAASPEMRSALDVARPPIKVAFRLAYEIGEFIAVQRPAQNQQGLQALAARAAGVMLEEGQRFLLRKLLHAGLREMRRLLRPQLKALDAAGRVRVKPQVQALLARLRSRPADPFDLSASAAQDFWLGVFADAAALATALATGGAPSADLKRALAAMWCAAQLLVVAGKRATRADTSLSVIGMPPQQTRTAFQGPLAAPPRIVADELVAMLGIAAPAGGFRLEHATSYLASAGVTTLLEMAAPEVMPFLDAFRGVFGTTTTAVAKTILENVGAVRPLGGGAIDAAKTLRDLLGVLRTLIETVVDAQAMPVARTALAGSPEALLYLDEVLRPGLGFALGACADILLEWPSGAVSAEAATEAFSAVILKLLGRTVVVTADVLQDFVARGTQGMLEEVATQVTSNGLAAKFAAVSGLPADIAAERAADLLRLVGRTLSPYTPDERRDLRNLYFAVLDPAPAAAGRAFIDQLASESFVPNAQAAARLVERSFDFFSERYVAFALGAIELAGAAFLELLAGALRAAAQALKQWMADAGLALAAAESRLAELGLELLQAADDAARLMNEALGALAKAFDAIGASARRNALKNSVADAFVARVVDVLDDNPVYRAIPSDLRDAARTSARNTARAVANGLAAPVFEAIASVAEEVAELLDDVRELDPSTGLASGIADLILDRVEHAVRAAFGGADPGFNVGFDFSYNWPELRLGLPPSIVVRTHNVHIALGRVCLPISRLVSLLREVISETSQFEAAINDAVDKLQAWLEQELLILDKLDEQDGVATEAEIVRSDRGAVSGAPRDLALSSPQAAAVYHDLIPVRVVLDDAAADFADFSRGPRRFFVHLNGVDLPVARFATEARILPTAVQRSFSAVALPQIAALAARAAGGAFASMPASGPARLGLSAPRRWSMDAVVAERGSLRMGVGLAAAVGASARVRGVVSAGRKPSGAPTSLAAGIDGLLIGRGGFVGAKPGAKLRDFDLARALDATPRNTVVLRTELGLNECESGLNTLCVTVIAADGSRLSRTATFVVDAAPIAALPVKPGEPAKPAPIFVPRRRPLDPAQMKPKPVKAALDVSARQQLIEAAKVAAIGRTIDPAARLSAKSPTLAKRLTLRPTPSPIDP